MNEEERGLGRREGRGESSFAGITRYFPGGRVHRLRQLAFARGDGEENNGNVEVGLCRDVGGCVGWSCLPGGNGSLDFVAVLGFRDSGTSTRAKEEEDCGRRRQERWIDRVYRRQIKRERTFLSSAFVVADSRIHAQRTRANNKRGIPRDYSPRFAPREISASLSSRNYYRRIAPRRGYSSNDAHLFRGLLSSVSREILGKARSRSRFCDHEEAVHGKVSRRSSKRATWLRYRDTWKVFNYGLLACA